MNTMDFDWKLLERTDLYEQYDFALDDLQIILILIRKIVERILLIEKDRASVIRPLEEHLKELEDICSL